MVQPLRVCHPDSSCIYAQHNDKYETEHARHVVLDSASPVVTRLQVGADAYVGVGAGGTTVSSVALTNCKKGLGCDAMALGGGAAVLGREGGVAAAGLACTAPLGGTGLSDCCRASLRLSMAADRLNVTFSGSSSGLIT